MRAVWSFWTKPFLEFRRSVWISDKHHLLSWVLSFNTARKHFGKTALWTDDAGARLLVDALGLEFDTVSIELNALTDHDAKWWALGKIYTYRLQNEPFIHIDNDAFLWKPLPVNSDSPLFAQNPDPFVPGSSYYMPERFEQALSGMSRGWLPKEWIWFRSSGHAQRAECCGVFGGTHIEFIRHYAELAIQIVEYPNNQKAFLALNDQVERNILVEQYLLSACIEYHKNCFDSPYSNLNICYLFNSITEAFDPRKAAEAGYTHLIGSAKKNKLIANKLEQRVKRDYPAAYERCMDLEKRLKEN